MLGTTSYCPRYVFKAFFQMNSRPSPASSWSISNFYCEGNLQVFYLGSVGHMMWRTCSDCSDGSLHFSRFGLDGCQETYVRWITAFSLLWSRWTVPSEQLADQIATYGRVLRNCWRAWKWMWVLQKTDSTCTIEYVSWLTDVELKFQDPWKHLMLDLLFPSKCGPSMYWPQIVLYQLPIICQTYVENGSWSCRTRSTA